MLAHCLRRRPNINTTVGQRLVFSDISLEISFPRKQETLTQCRVNVGPPHAASAQN